MDGYISYPRTGRRRTRPATATAARSGRAPRWASMLPGCWTATWCGRAASTRATIRRSRRCARRRACRAAPTAGGVLVHRQAVFGEPVPRREAGDDEGDVRAAGERFGARGRTLVDAVRLEVLPHRAGGGGAAGAGGGRKLAIAKCELVERDGGARADLEAELIGAMEAHGIGTDASIPQHIGNIEARRYAKMGPGRLSRRRRRPRAHPRLWKDRSRARLPTVRSHVERQLELVAKGERRAAVVAHCLGGSASSSTTSCAHLPNG